MNFIQFAAARGLIINSLVYGKWMRVKTVDHPHKQNGAYFFSGEFGHVQNWATMPNVESWCENKEMTTSQQVAMNSKMAASKKEYAEKRAKAQQVAAKKAEWILSQCHLDVSGYLAAKGFPEMLGNMWMRPDAYPLLVIPMRHNEILCGVQLIGHDGHKRFLSGARTNDAYFKIGSGKDIFLCEGYANGISLQVVLDALKIKYSIYICFSANNVLRISRMFPGARICADNDESLTGQRIAEASGRRWWMSDSIGEDINDMHQRIGKFALMQEIKNFLTETKR